MQEPNTDHSSDPKPRLLPHSALVVMGGTTSAAASAARPVLRAATPTARQRAPVARRMPFAALAADQGTPPRHGRVPSHDRHDEYAWMREVGSGEMAGLMRAETAHTEAVARGWTGVKAIEAELASVALSSADEPPEPCRGYWYWRSMAVGDNLGGCLRRVPMSPGVSRWRDEAALGVDTGRDSPTTSSLGAGGGKGPKGSDTWTRPASSEVAFDFEELANRHEFAMIDGLAFSRDGRYLALLLDTDGTEEWRCVIREVATGRQLVADEVPNVRRVDWAGVGAPHLLYYTAVDEQGRPIEVRRHTLGTPTEDDEVLALPAAPEGSLTDITATKDGAYIAINRNTKTSSEVWLVDAGTRDAQPVLIAPREEGVQYFVEHHDGWLYIVTNRGGSPDYKLVRTRVETPSAECWVDIVPARSGVVVEDFDVVKGFGLLYERAWGTPQVSVVDLRDSGGAHPVVKTLPLPDSACQVEPGTNAHFDSTVLRYTVSYPTKPPTVHEVDVCTGESEEIAKHYLSPSRGNTERAYQHKRLHARSHDGATVPVDIVYSREHASTDMSTRPLLMQAYGAYGVPLETAFDPSQLPLLNRGWILAFAHVRGGGGLGREWEAAGRGMNKLNTFHDAEAVLSQLHLDGYSCPALTAVEGFSAGALIPAYLANERPDLLAAAHLKMPFLDVMGDMLDLDHHLTALEFADWGDPRDPQAAEYIASYSPYDRVSCHAYPSILAIGAVNDPRVGPWHPLSFIARVREAHAEWAEQQAAAGAQEGSDSSREPPLHLAYVCDTGGHFQHDTRALELAFLHEALGLEME